MVLYLPDSWLSWSLEISVFEEQGKPEYLEKNLSEQRREPATNSTQIWRQRQNLNPGHSGGRLVLSPLHHPCPPNRRLTSQLFSGCLLTVFDFFHKLVIGAFSYYRVVQSTRKVGYFNDFPLISLQVTDMMQKALFDYMKHKFSGR